MKWEPVYKYLMRYGVSITQRENTLQSKNEINKKDKPDIRYWGSYLCTLKHENMTNVPIHSFWFHEKEEEKKVFSRILTSFHEALYLEYLKMILITIVQYNLCSVCNAIYQRLYIYTI